MPKLIIKNTLKTASTEDNTRDKLETARDIDIQNVDGEIEKLNCFLINCAKKCLKRKTHNKQKKCIYIYIFIHLSNHEKKIPIH